MLIEISVGWTLFLFLLTVVGVLLEYVKHNNTGVLLIVIATYLVIYYNVGLFQIFS